MTRRFFNRDSLFCHLLNYESEDYEGVVICDLDYKRIEVLSFYSSGSGIDPHNPDYFKYCIWYKVWNNEDKTLVLHQEITDEDFKQKMIEACKEK